MLDTEPEALRCRLSPCQQHQEHSISQHLSAEESLSSSLAAVLPGMACGLCPPAAAPTMNTGRVYRGARVALSQSCALRDPQQGGGRAHAPGQPTAVAAQSALRFLSARTRGSEEWTQ
jgi:hypothetical protein